jgi:phosphatidylinositol 4-kinase A
MLKMDTLIDQLAALLLPIDALLSHEDFQPKRDTKTITLFRNMWFLCILFEFHLILDQPYTVNAWRQAALARIAEKTPPIVVEEAQDYVLNDLEYNSIIRQNFAHLVRAVSLVLPERQIF